MHAPEHTISVLKSGAILSGMSVKSPDAFSLHSSHSPASLKYLVLYGLFVLDLNRINLVAVVINFMILTGILHDNIGSVNGGFQH